MKCPHRRTDPTSKVVTAMRNARMIRQLALAATALAAIGGFLIAAYNATSAEGAGPSLLFSSVFTGFMLLVFASALPPSAAKYICARFRDREPLYKAATTIFFWPNRIDPYVLLGDPNHATSNGNRRS